MMEIVYEQNGNSAWRVNIVGLGYLTRSSAGLCIATNGASQYSSQQRAQDDWEAYLKLLVWYHQQESWR